MGKPKKAERPAVVSLIQSTSAKAPDDPEGKSKWPALLELLCPIWEDGVCKRQAGKLQITLTGPYFIISLGCPTERVECQLMVESLSTALDELEASLHSGRAKWVDDWRKKKESRKVVIDSVH